MGQETAAPKTGTRHLVALAVPTLVFAGYDLARRAYLPQFLASLIGLGMAGAVVGAVGLWCIACELLFGSLGDRAPRGWPVRRFWIGLGTACIALAGLGMLVAAQAGSALAVAALLPLLASSWIITNISHGSWALETAATAADRLRIFSLRALAGIVGVSGFAAVLGATERAQLGLAAHPFLLLVAASAVLSIAAHLALIVCVAEPQRPRQERHRPQLVAPLRLLWSSPAHRHLALLFALVGLHVGVDSASFLFIVDAGLGLPGWGATAIGVKAAASALGLMSSWGWGRHWPPPRRLALVMAANALVALLLLAVPHGAPAWLLLWSAASGLFAALDFILLRVMLSELLHERADAKAPAAAALHYAAFHMPFNIMAALGSALILALYQAFGLRANHLQETVQSYGIVIIMPVLLSATAAITGVLLLAFRTTNSKISFVKSNSSQKPWVHAVPSAGADQHRIWIREN